MPAADRCDDHRTTARVHLKAARAFQCQWQIGRGKLDTASAAEYAGGSSTPGCFFVIWTRQSRSSVWLVGAFGKDPRSITQGSPDDPGESAPSAGRCG